MQAIDEYSICTDCLFWHAYGDLPSDTERDADEFLADVRRTLGEDLPNFVAMGDPLGFSWSACQSCGSTLGGDRFSAVILA